MRPEFRAKISGPETLIVSLAFHDQLGEDRFRTGAKVADNFGCCEGTDLATTVQVHALGETVQEARREQITGTGGIHNTTRGVGIDNMKLG